MPVFNADRFVGQAIESILRQTFGDFEFIIIDDGSTDGSLQIIQRYASSDNRIKIISRENRGSAASSNEAVGLARGQWIARIDADDIAAPTRFERQLAYAQQKGLDICGTWAKCFGTKQVSWKYPVSSEAISILMLFDSPLCHSSVLGKTCSFKAQTYRSEFYTGEDFDLWQRLAGAGAKLGNVPEFLVKYRVHADQISERERSDMVEMAQKIRLRQWLVLCGDSQRKEAGELLRAFAGEPVRLEVVYPLLAKLGKTLTGESLKVFLFNIFRIYCRTAADNYRPWVTWDTLLQEIGVSPRPGEAWILKLLKLLNLTSDSPKFKALKNIYLRMR
ncbi:MAG TPA: glycosyltransferase [Candidatus Limnocylindrales bacterium]|nr:glycosyltransferase [Candidatus Limnocylindrales bacterium]